MNGRRLLFEAKSGNEAYGLGRRQATCPARRVYLAPRSYYLGVGDDTARADVATCGPQRDFELRSFLRLAAAGAPAAFELLWADPDDQLVLLPQAEVLVSGRDSFLSRRVAVGFGAAAARIIVRLQRERAWIETAMTGAPELVDFPVLHRDDAWRSPLAVGVLVRDHRYEQARRRWREREAWSDQRSAHQSMRDARLGFDSALAMQAIRLLRMAIEILEEGRVLVRRPDVGDLLSVRDGAWSFDAVCGHLDDLGQELVEVTACSPLPVEPDEARLTELFAGLLGDHLLAEHLLAE